MHGMYTFRIRKSWTAISIQLMSQQNIPCMVRGPLELPNSPSIRSSIPCLSPLYAAYEKKIPRISHLILSQTRSRNRRGRVGTSWTRRFRFLKISDCILWWDICLSASMISHPVVRQYVKFNSFENLSFGFKLVVLFSAMIFSEDSEPKFRSSLCVSRKFLV